MREVVIRMNQHPWGAACVLDTNQKLLGIITDGDVRRLLSSEGDILQMKVGDCMTKTPIYTQTDVSLGDALKIMEDRSSQISVLPVLEGDAGTFVGLLRLHDAYQPNFS